MKSRITKNGENSFCISAERLSVREIQEGKRTRLTPLFEYQKGDKELFRPLKILCPFSKGHGKYGGVRDCPSDNRRI